jgi:putative ABC transport system ATP-binding protein
MNIAVEGRDIRKTYRGDGADIEALRGISLELHCSEFVAITGPSGCGKSTLLNILACVDRPSAGAVIIDGVDVSGLNDDQLTAVRRDSIGYVFQFFNLLPALTVAENVALPLVLAGARRKRTDAAVSEALERVGIANLSHRSPSTLSGGQQQRAAIARAIVRRPAIVLADEPTGNLDSTTGRDILALLRSLCDDLNTALLMATHGIDTISTVDRVIRMRDGAIEQ